MSPIPAENGCNHAKKIVRPVNEFPPSSWGDRFLNYTYDSKLAEKYFEEMEALKDEVKILLTNGGSEMVETMDLIDKLERLGISYHFEKEIEQKLGQFFDLNTNYEEPIYDLCTISTHFRLYRQHGYRINSEIFRKFKDCEGNFKSSFKSDARGLLSMYEAAHLRIHGESILEEALVFAIENLKCMVPYLSPPLKKQVEYALVQPLHFGYPRFEIHRYISIYEREDSKSESLLKFAKLDYNALQMLHKHELCELSRWWKDLGLVSSIPYARDRLVECHFWAVGTSPLPQNSRTRVMLTKVIKFLSLTDDTFDVYGTIEELDKFTEAIQRWDIREIDGLPHYMKPLYDATLKLFEGFKEELAKEGRSFVVDYVIDAFKEQVRGYNIEAKWLIRGSMPTFSKYLANGLITSGYFLVSNASLMGTYFARREEYEWLSEKPRMATASEEVNRIIGDIASYEVEKGRGQKSTGIDIYMMENGLQKEEAITKMTEMATNAWKDINESLLMPFPVSKEVLLNILNITRVIDVVYKNSEDGYTHPERVIKPHIAAIYMNPFKI